MKPVQIFLLPPEDRRPAIGRLSAFLVMTLPGKRVKVEVGEYHARRSNEQNAALWGLAYPILREATGADVDDLHEFLLGEWSGWETYDVLGKKRQRPRRRSSQLSRAEFTDYFGFVQRRAAEYGVFIPDPDPFWREHQQEAG